MKKNKKGTDAATPMPYMEKEVSMTNNQVHSNTASNISLMLFMAFAILTIAGVYIDNDLITFFGLGIGVADSVIILQKNLREDD